MFNPCFSAKFISDAFWSFSGNGASILAGLFTVKIITKWVTPEAYGYASLLLGIVAVLNGMLVGPLMVAHLRLYFDYRDRGLEDWYVGAFRRIFVAFGFFAATGYLSFALFSLWRGEPLFLRHLAAVLFVVLSQPFFSARANYLEANRQQKSLAILNVLLRVLQPCFLLLLLIAAFPPIDALLVAQGMALVGLPILYASSRMVSEVKQQPAHDAAERSNLARQIKAFGWTLPVTFLVMWILTTADRYMLQYYTTPANVGRYAMNYGIWSMPFICLNGWLEILTRPLIYESAAEDQWTRVREIITWRIGVGMLASIVGGALLFLLARPIAAIMLSDQYWIGIEFVMVIAGAHCLFVLGYSIVPIFIALKKMEIVLFATAVAASTNLIANWYAIPQLGLMGAAFATLIAYVSWVLVLALAAQSVVRERVALKSNVPDRNPFGTRLLDAS